MIRLIAADMDGTLLNSRQELPKELFPLIDSLAARGVYFAAASGRQYYNLRHIFEPVKDKMFFVAENGGVVFHQGKNIYVSAIDPVFLPEVVDCVRGLGAAPFLCGLQASYSESEEAVLTDNAKMYYYNYQVLDNVLKAQDTICKIAVFDYTDAEKNVFHQLRDRFGDVLEVSLSGQHWVDLSMPGTNKGTAIKRIQEQFGIGFDETMLFGDYLNDYEMMKVGHYSYAMANAHPELKAICNYETLSNDDNGVIEAIRQVCPEAFDTIE
ncbi:MAG: HAD family hydrolase [Eubacterium sp.]|nr:HAD family hydrolase [Eubacterium sp.]